MRGFSLQGHHNFTGTPHTGRSTCLRADGKPGERNEDGLDKPEARASGEYGGDRVNSVKPLPRWGSSYAEVDRLVVPNGFKTRSLRHHAQAPTAARRGGGLALQAGSNRERQEGLMGSSGNGQDPSTYCSDCKQKITTDKNGNESGHASDCEWR